jgi:hypothetical protein
MLLHRPIADPRCRRCCVVLRAPARGHGSGQCGRLRHGLSHRRCAGRAGARPRHGLAGKRLLLCRCAQRAGHSSHRIVALVCSTYSIGYLRDDQQSGELGDDLTSVKEQLAQLRMYYTLTPLFVFSMMFMAVANNLGVMWAAIEATTLVSVFLVTFYGKVTSLEAAWKYAIIGGVGLSMALFGTIGDLLCGPPPARLRCAQRVELVCAGAARRATRQDLDAAGLRSHSHGLWNQGGPRAHAHVEAGCLQRGPGAFRRNSLFGDAQLRPLRPHPFLHPYQPVPWPGVPWPPAAALRACSRWASPFRSSWCSRTIAACWPITPSIMPVSWSRRWDSEGRWAAWV